VFITADKKIYVTDGLKDTFIFKDEARNLNMLKKGDFFILGFVLILIIVSLPVFTFTRIRVQMLIK